MTRNIDTIKYNYPSIWGAPNILWEQPKDKTDPEPPVHWAELRPLVSKLARRHPAWKLIVTTAYPYNVSMCDAVYILQSGEHLGMVSKDYRGAKIGFRITNDRVSSGMQRSNYKWTSDIEKARRLIEANFKPSTLAELLPKAVAKTNAQLGRLRGDAHIAQSRNRQAIVDRVDRYVLTLQKAHRDALKVFGVTDEMMDAMPELVGRANMFSYLAASASGYTVVVTNENEYIAKTGDQTEVFGRDTLPATLQRNIGMLKLTDNHQFIDGIGMRLSEGFMVLGHTPEVKE